MKFRKHLILTIAVALLVAPVGLAAKDKYSKHYPKGKPFKHISKAVKENSKSIEELEQWVANLQVLVDGFHPPPPPACYPGTDFVYTDFSLLNPAGEEGAWVVCTADENGTWISPTAPESTFYYDIVKICQKLGYNAVDQVGVNGGRVCGDIDDEVTVTTSCEQPGTEPAIEAGNFTVLNSKSSWTCVK